MPDLDRHFAEDEVCPFVGKSEQFSNISEKPFTKPSTHVRVQEEPGKQDFDHEQLDNKANADFFAVTAYK